MSTQEKTPHVERTTRRAAVNPYALWYAVIGGVVAWAAHLLVAWSDMEVSCFAPASGMSILQHGGHPQGAEWWVVGGAVVVPWLVTAAAFITCLVLHRRLARAEGVDPVERGRTSFLLVIGIFLDLMSLAVITGGGIALLVVDPCS
jgi:hypothetical protein